MTQTQPSTTETGSKSGSLAPAHNGTPPHHAPAYPATPTVRVAKNGAHATLTASTPPPPRRGGGIRGVVRGRTRGSRGRFVRMLAGIDQTRHPADSAICLTITYPTTWPPSPEEWATDLKKFRQRLERRFGPVGVLWLREHQGRGAPHHHLVVLLPGGMFARQFTRAARRAWLAVTGNGSATHLRRGAHGKPLQSWRKVRGYLSKDEPLPTEATTGRPEPTGRTWGVWRRELLTIRYRTIPLTGKAYLQLRRIFRRIARPVSGRSGFRADVFQAQHALVSEAEMLKLLELLAVDTS